MRRPLLWIAVCWIAGMSVASQYDWMGIAIGASIIGCLTLGWTAASGGRHGFLFGLLLAVGFIVSAGYYERVDAGNVTVFPWEDDIEREVLLGGTIDSKPQIDGDRAVFNLAVSTLSWEDGHLNAAGELVKVYVRFDSQEDRKKAEVWKRGDEAVVSGTLKAPLSATNFDTFDYKEFLQLSRVFWTIRGKAADTEVETPFRWSAARALSYVDSFRDRLARPIDRMYEQPVSGFIKGLVLGIRDDLDPEQFREFSQIGLTHLLAISGLHVGIYVGSVVWLLRRLPMTRETRLLWTMAAVPPYVLLTGAAPSAVRAGIMAMIVLYAARRNLLKDGMNVLAAAALLMLVWNPYYLHNVSFQLSFTVTAGLIAGVPIVSRGLPIANRFANSALSVTLVAQLVSFPLTIFYFNGFSLLSFFANLVMVPLFSMVILPVGSVSLLLWFLSPAIAALPAWCVERLTLVCFYAVDKLNNISGAFTIWATPPLWWIAFYFAVLWLLLLSFSSRLPHLCISCAAAFCLVLAYAYNPDWNNHAATVSFLDVGQGDAILIRTPEGQTILIDGGGTLRFTKPGDEWRMRNKPYEVGRDFLVPLLKRRGVHHIDALFLSHQDTDHIGGLRAVIEEIPVRRVFFNGTVKSNEDVKKWFAIAVKNGIPLTPAYSGMNLSIDSETSIRFLHPSHKTEEQMTEEDGQNGASLVFLLTVYSKTFLFTGDIGAAEERSIAAGLHIPLTDVDVLKIAHHGSKNSTTSEWLAAWKPPIGVISVGRTNGYGHPHPTVTERLTEHRVMTYRTDHHGEIQFRVSPFQFLIRTKLGSMQSDSMFNFAIIE